jgi:hypothetical protein
MVAAQHGRRQMSQSPASLKCHDPIGPGSPAWQAADRAIACRLIDDEEAFLFSRNEMISFLKEANASPETIDEWDGFIWIAQPD